MAINSMNLKIPIPKGAAYIISRLNEAGYPSYIVGGCVRDSLLGLQPHDWDICTAATPEEMKAALSNNISYDTGVKHGTITILSNDDRLYEVTTFREDGTYTDNRHPDSVYFVKDVCSDLARRDFTINAMAYSMADGLIDPFDGQKDLVNGIIRCVGNPSNRFHEDALRILRALRFASTYGFSISDRTSSSIHSLFHLLSHISAERINMEMTKLLLGANAYLILHEYSDVMAEIIPELKPCIGLEQESKYHCHDVYEHTIHAVTNYEGNDPIIKWALLLHDIGKPSCKTFDTEHGEPDGYAHYYGHGHVSKAMAEKVIDRLHMDGDSKRKILQLVEHHDYSFQSDDASVKRVLNRFGEEQAERLFQVRWADIAAHEPGCLTQLQERVFLTYERMHELIKEQPCFQLKNLAINGDDLIAIGMKPSKEMGECLNECLNAVIDGIVPNEKTALLGWVDERCYDIGCR